MFFSDLVNAIVRRWYIAVAGMFALAIAFATVIATVPTRYEATGQLLLLPPAEQTLVGDRLNPYLLLPNGLTFTATLLASEIMQPSAERALVAEGLESTYAVSVPPQSGPLIVFSVQGTDQPAALAQRNVMMTRIEDQLATLQASEAVPDDQLIVSRTFNTADSVEVLAGSKIRALAASAAVIGLVTVLVLFDTDRRLERRLERRRQAAQRASGAESQSTGLSEGSPSSRGPGLAVSTDETGTSSGRSREGSPVHASTPRSGSR